MVEVGQGTQRVEEALARMFPSASITRIDRDSTRRKGELQNQLRRISEGEVDIAIGTQLITKGHDFPKLGLVGILDADAGLFSTDYRAPEYLFQQLLQVAGRAGRDQQQGKVLIQTAFAEHPLFDFAKAHDYVGFSETLIRERMESGLPPFSYLVVVRAESVFH